MIHQEAEFIGIDANTEPYLLSGGYWQQADNVVVNGGNFVTRPPIIGLLSVAMAGGPIYSFAEYCRIDNGHMVLIFAQGGKLWQWDANAGFTTGTAPTELKINGTTSFSFPGGGVTVRLTRYGKFLYGCDGMHPLFRVNLENGLTAYSSAMIAPSAPTVSLANTTIDDATNATAWTGYPAPSSTANLISNGGFESGTYTSSTGTNYPITNWATITGTPDARDNTHDSYAHDSSNSLFGSFSLLLDNPLDATQQILGTLPTYNLSGFGLANQTARVFSGMCYVHNGDSTSASAGFVTVAARNATPAVIASHVVSLTQAYNSNANALTAFPFAVSFSDVSTDPASLAVMLSAGANNTTGNASFYIDNFALQAAAVQIAVRSVGGANPLLAYLPGISAANGNLAAAPYVAGQWICRTFVSATDLSGNQIISLGVSIPSTSLNAAGELPGFRFGFMSATDTTIQWSNVCNYSDDGATLYCDVSTVALASRSSCKRFFLGFLDNLPNADPANLFHFGPLTGAGSLTLGGVYTYEVTEVQTFSGTYPAGDVDESAGSVLSAAVTITDLDAQVNVVIGARANDGTNGRGLADHFAIYRQGGVFSDTQSDGTLYPFWRYEAVVPYGAPATGPGWTWTPDLTGATAGTFRDDIPDSALIGAAVYQPNRDYFPTGAVDPTNPTAADPRGAVSALAVANGRLYAAAGNTILASWLLASDQEAGLYTSNITDFADPSQAIKGATLTLGSGQESDTVVALAPLSTAIAILRQNVITLLNGYQPSNYATIDQYIQSGVGCVAPFSVVVNATGGSICYLGTDGLRLYDQDIPSITGQEIKPLLGIVNKTSTISASGPFARAVQVLHEGCRYLFVPAVGSDPFLPSGASQTTNSLCYVWDGDTGGFTRWVLPVAISAAIHADGTLYLGGVDGQIYTLSPSQTVAQDKATPTATATNINMAMTTRALGETIPAARRSAQGQTLIGQATEASMHDEKPNHYHFELFTAAASVPVNLSLVGSRVPSNVWTTTYTTRSEGGETNPEKGIRVDSSVSGNHLTLGLSASVSVPLRVRRVAIESVLGRRR